MSSDVPDVLSLQPVHMVSDAIIKKEKRDRIANLPYFVMRLYLSLVKVGEYGQADIQKSVTANTQEALLAEALCGRQKD